MRHKETASLLLAIATSTLLAEQSPFDLQSNLQKIERSQQMILKALKSESPSDDDFGLEEKTAPSKQAKRKEIRNNPIIVQKPHPLQAQSTKKHKEQKTAPKPKSSQNVHKTEASSHSVAKQTVTSQAETKKTANEINAAVSKLNELLKEDRQQYAKKIAERSAKEPKSKEESKTQKSDDAQTDLKKALHDAIRAVDRE